jgi:hypothetical protein
MNQRYYIAVPNKVKWTYQTIPTWKNYSFTGTLEEARQKALELFKQEGYLYDELEDLFEFYDEDKYNQIYEKWDNLDDQEKYECCKEFL